MGQLVRERKDMQTVRDIWRYGQIDVMYERELDGGGTLLTPPLLEFISSFDGKPPHFDRALDCFAGPGFFGFGLVAEELCNSVCLTDLNATAIEYARNNITANRLEDRVRAYVSDILAGVPKEERFDLVIANPPWYWSLNPAHPLYPLMKSKHDLVPQDTGWSVHSAFYSQVGAFLNPGALVFVLEADPHKREVTVAGSALDVRPEPPGKVFQQMMQRGGLTHISDNHLWTEPCHGGQVWVQVSRKPN
jgi:methylase of polypeptide subunit release factors